MKRIELNELKKISVDILKFIDTVCRDNNINYFIGFGTLIGAVRHKGFIPWDDDIDICMLRKDYEKFINVMAKNSNDQYRFISRETDPNYYFIFGRVSDQRTIIKRRPHPEIANFGIWVDVFPIDNAPKKEDRKEWLAHFLELRKKVYFTVPTTLKYCNWKNPIETLRMHLGRKKLMRFYKLENFEFYQEQFHNWVKQFNSEPSEEVMVAQTPYGMKAVFPRYLFDETVDLEFEGFLFKAPKKYDEFLRMLYGDYMVLPPVEKRITHHHFVAYWK